MPRGYVAGGFLTSASDFRYVDFASRSQPGFRNHVAPLSDVPDLLRRYHGSDCYCTYYLFDDALPEYMARDGGSVAGYDGPCYAHYLPFDIDSPDLDEAQATARDIADYAIDRMGVSEEGLAIYFSGSKGFHLAVASAAFGGVDPGVDLPNVFRYLREGIVEDSKPSRPETVDFAISDRLRLLRLPNTRHSKSGLYKVPLSLRELEESEPDELRHLASKPRQPVLTDETGLLPRFPVEATPEAEELLARCVERAERMEHSALPDPGRFLDSGNVSHALCDAEMELYREGVSEGCRASVGLRLASRFRAAGYSEDVAEKMVSAFASRCEPALPAQEVRAVVRSAYRANGNGYQFGCGNGNGDAPHTKPVQERCPYRGRSECAMYSAVVNGHSKGMGR